MRDRGAAGGSALEGAGTDGCGGWHVARVHRGAGSKGAVIAKLEQAGGEIEIVNKTTVRVRGAKKLAGSDMTTEEYPGFATDMQAQYMALATQAEGTSVISETIFENRYLHASEMIRMG